MSFFDSIYADTLLPPRAVSVYMYLKDRSNRAGSCWPGIKTIARDMNLSRSTVKRALADLEQHGYLAKLPRYRPNGSNTSNLYSTADEIGRSYLIKQPQYLYRGYADGTEKPHARCFAE